MSQRAASPRSSSKRRRILPSSTTNRASKPSSPVLRPSSRRTSSAADRKRCPAPSGFRRCGGQRPQASRLAFVMLAELRSAGHYARFRSRFYPSLQRSEEHQILESAIIRGGQDFRAPHALVAGTDIADDAIEGERATDAAPVEIPYFHAGFWSFHSRVLPPRRKAGVCETRCGPIEFRQAVRTSPLPHPL